MAPTTDSTALTRFQRDHIPSKSAHEAALFAPAEASRRLRGTFTTMVETTPARDNAPPVILSADAGSGSAADVMMTAAEATADPKNSVKNGARSA